MLDFIRLLKHRYKIVLENIRSDTIWQQGLRVNLGSLALAEAFLDKGEIIRTRPEHPLQIAVVGPTQAGKSTLVNLLLQEPLAGVSPLAGYTVHSQGFCVNTQTTKLDWLTEFFVDYKRVGVTALSPSQLDCYAIIEAAPNPDHPLDKCMIWDTPDFDSIHSSSYRSSMLRTVALADIVLLVISKDKYADQSVWDMMSLLQPMNQQTIICLNKTQAANQSVIEHSLSQKWSASRQDDLPPIVSLPYCEGPPVIDALKVEIDQLFDHLKNCGDPANRQNHQPHADALVAKHWPKWTDPIKAEHQAGQQWAEILENGIEDALNLYQRDYLDHPQHYETFQKALAQLLRLLEIPGLAPVLYRARQVITWPARKLFGIGKSRAGDMDNQLEATILEQVQDHFVIQLAEAILEKSEDDNEQRSWWLEMSKLLKSEKETLRHQYNIAMQAYLTDFEPEIEAAAQRLYQKLEQQPATLNSLRATRVTADAAALAVALHTGGIGVHDFVITPAVLSVTSLLAESALGSYMNKIGAELKQRQFEIVKDILFVGILKQLLQDLPHKMDNSNKFNISTQQLTDVETQLKEPRYGLRLS